MRLDAFLASRDTRHSRNRFKGLIKTGCVRIDGQTLEEPNFRVNAGQDVESELPPPQDPVPEGEAIPLDIVYEDADLIVINKPAGLVVHPAAGNWSGTLVNALIHHCGDQLSGIGGVRRPGIVHRLDKETSGLIVIAKSDAAHQGLARQFADHGRNGPLERRYQALVWGEPTPSTGSVETYLDRDPRNRRKRVVTAGARKSAKHAKTRYTTLERFPPGTGSAAMSPAAISHIACELETGRTHQIRVHMAHIGHPLLGDPLYGAGFRTKADTLPREPANRIRKLPRQALHASDLGFQHPVTKEIVRLQSPLPDDLAALLCALQRMSGEPG